MTLARRHYVAIAEVLKNVSTFNANNTGDEAYIPACTLGDLVEDLCNYFESDNPRFKRDLFIEAASGKFDD